MMIEAPLMVVEERQYEAGLSLAAETITIPPEGHPIRYTWTPVAGATGAEVESASLTISASSTQKPIGGLKAVTEGSSIVVTTSDKRIRSLKISDLDYVPGGEDEDVPLKSQSDLENNNLRLVVTIPDGKGGWLPPLHAVPPVWGHDLMPASLTGASFENGVLTLPDLVAPRVSITVAKGSTADDFTAQSSSFSSVSGTETILPKDLQVIAPDGSVAWAFPGEFPAQAPAAEVDLHVPLQTAFHAAITHLDVTFTIKGSGTISLYVDTARGALVRKVPGVTRTVLEGKPVLPQLGGALPATAPSSATADLTVQYDGIRVHETFSDETPSQKGDLHGVIVTDAGAQRVFPPAGLNGLTIRRVAVIGRAPVDCELHVQLVEAASGKPLGTPAVLTLAPSTEIAPHWVELPEHPPLTLPTNLSLTAVKGRFFWVSGGDHPLTKIAIYDPDYADREVALGGTPLNVAAAHQPAYALPTAVFTNAAPVLRSNLFLTVDLSDLVLRYVR